MKEELQYPSKDHLTTIHAVRWVPDSGEVRGVLQICHGMVEFIERYRPFAEFLNDEGFVVTGNDHLGHGRSVLSDDELGYFAKRNGNAAVIGDIRTLHLMTLRAFPKVPYFILGHSMGSFLARQYIELYAENLSGAVIMGTGWQSQASLASGMAIAKTLAAIKSDHSHSRLLDAVAMGSYNKHFAPSRTKYDWLTKDEAIVDAYAANPLNTFHFTVNAYYNMFAGLSFAEKPENIAKIPRDFPILLVSGADDPVGNFGKGVEKARKSYEKCGLSDLTMKLFPGDRHEILNETDNDLVFTYILNWIRNRMPQNG